MATYRGLMGDLEDTGRARLYLLADSVGQFVEFDPAAASEIRAESDVELTTHSVEIGAADVIHGTLSPVEFDAQFTDADAPTARALDAYIGGRDPRDPHRTLDGTHFRCCVTHSIC